MACTEWTFIDPFLRCCSNIRKQCNRPLTLQWPTDQNHSGINRMSSAAAVATLSKMCVCILWNNLALAWKRSSASRTRVKCQKRASQILLLMLLLLLPLTCGNAIIYFLCCDLVVAAQLPQFSFIALYLGSDSEAITYIFVVHYAE